MPKRSEDSPGTVFNISSQNAANINNVGRDMNVNAPQHIEATIAITAMRQHLQRVRSTVENLPLPHATWEAANQSLDSAEQELASPKPDKARLAGHLEELTGVLKGAGALATAGTVLVQPLQQLAALLGPLGARILQMLPM